MTDRKDEPNSRVTNRDLYALLTAWSGRFDAVTDRVDGVYDRLDGVSGELASIRREVAGLHVVVNDQVHAMDVRLARLERGWDLRVALLRGSWRLTAALLAAAGVVGGLVDRYGPWLAGQLR